jgi:hypothetical protein
MIRLIAALLFATLLDAQTAVPGKVTSIVDGHPIAGAAIVLQGDDDAYMAETDGEGRFRIDAVIPGRYQAKSQREGFLLRRTVRLTVAADVPTPELDVRMTPLGAISGRVVDTDGDPISKIQVEALRYVYTDGKKHLDTAGQGRTDDRGVFSIIGLAPGRYYLRASDSLRGSWPNNLPVLTPKPPTSYGTVWFPNALDAESAVSLEVGPGSELRDHEIRLRPQRSYTISVRLAGGDESGRPRLSIVAPAGMSLMIDFRYGVPFMFPDARPGAYRIEAVDEKSRLAVRRTVKVTDSDLDVAFTLTPPLHLSGSVRLESGEPAVAKLRLESDDDERSPAGESKADGSLAIEVQPVAYTVHVDPGPGAYVKSLKLGEHELTAPRIDLARGVEPLAITLARDGGTLTGRVDVEDAIVVLAPRDAFASWPDRTRSVTAHKDGSFELRDIAPGDYDVFAWADAEPGAPLDPGFRRSFREHAVSVHIAPNGSATVELKAL